MQITWSPGPIGLKAAQNRFSALAERPAQRVTPRDQADLHGAADEELLRQLPKALSDMHWDIFALPDPAIRREAYRRVLLTRLKDYTLVGDRIPPVTNFQQTMHQGQVHSEWRNLGSWQEQLAALGAEALIRFDLASADMKQFSALFPNPETYARISTLRSTFGAVLQGHGGHWNNPYIPNNVEALQTFMTAVAPLRTEAPLALTPHTDAERALESLPQLLTAWHLDPSKIQAPEKRRQAYHLIFKTRLTASKANVSGLEALEQTLSRRLKKRLSPDEVQQAAAALTAELMMRLDHSYRTSWETKQVLGGPLTELGQKPGIPSRHFVDVFHGKPGLKNHPYIPNSDPGVAYFLEADNKLAKKPLVGKPLLSDDALSQLLTHVN